MGSFDSAAAADAAEAAPPFAPVVDDDDVVNKYTAIANDVAPSLGLRLCSHRGLSQIYKLQRNRMKRSFRELNSVSEAGPARFNND